MRLKGSMFLKWACLPIPNLFCPLRKGQGQMTLMQLLTVYPILSTPVVPALLMLTLQALPIKNKRKKQKQLTPLADCCYYQKGALEYKRLLLRPGNKQAV